MLERNPLCSCTETFSGNKTHDPGRRGDVSMGPWTEDTPLEVQPSKSKLTNLRYGFRSCGPVRPSSGDDGKVFFGCWQSFQEAWGSEQWPNGTQPLHIHLFRFELLKEFLINDEMPFSCIPCSGQSSLPALLVS